MTETAAEVCRRNGWEAGDVLQMSWKDNGGTNLDTIQVTAIGVDSVLSRSCKYDTWGIEGSWLLMLSKFEKIATAPLDDTPPKKEWFHD